MQPPPYSEHDEKYEDIDPISPSRDVLVVDFCNGVALISIIYYTFALGVSTEVASTGFCTPCGVANALVWHDIGAAILCGFSICLLCFAWPQNCESFVAGLFVTELGVLHIVYALALRFADPLADLSVYGFLPIVIFFGVLYFLGRLFNMGYGTPKQSEWLAYGVFALFLMAMLQLFCCDFSLYYIMGQLSFDIACVIVMFIYILVY